MNAWHSHIVAYFTDRKAVSSRLKTDLFREFESIFKKDRSIRNEFLRDRIKAY